MDKNQNRESIEETIERKLREAERIAFREDALSDDDARESVIAL